MQKRTTPPDILEAVRREMLLGPVGAAEECVGTFLWLCSDEMSGYGTGQVVEVNGGLLMP